LCNVKIDLTMTDSVGDYHCFNTSWEGGRYRRRMKKRIYWGCLTKANEERKHGQNEMLQKETGARLGQERKESGITSQGQTMRNWNGPCIPKSRNEQKTLGRYTMAKEKVYVNLFVTFLIQTLNLEVPKVHKSIVPQDQVFFCGTMVLES
jgi:hypothetical protein